GLAVSPVFTYLANTIRIRERAIPYSLVAATGPTQPEQSSILLNEWAARDLQAKPGDTVTLDYYLWKEDGRLVTESAQFVFQGAVNRYDRDLAPEYPGMTDAKSLHDWDPPFPIDLARIRPRDEEYWKQYRAAPKAFIALSRGQQLWQSRFGKLTSIRLAEPRPEFAQRLREALDPLRAGVTVQRVRAEGLQAAQGSTDFGEYFLYFSFFLVVSALLLAGLFFKLGVEQRLREIGLLQALGFSNARIRALFLAEGALLAAAGAILGTAGAAGYAALVLLGLRTWWIDAVGTRLITLHVSAASLAAGAAGGMVTAALCVALTLRGLRAASPRSLLAGVKTSPAARPRRSRRVMLAGVTCLLIAGAVLTAAGETAGFFGAGSLLLAALLCFQWAWLAGPHHRVLRSLVQLGVRSATHRPSRSVLSIALIAFATFLISAVDAFRREGAPPLAGYPLLAESILPLYHDPNTAAGRQSLNLPALDGVRFARFRLRPGDDSSCLNLYQPRNPRILAASSEFIRERKDAVWSSLEAPLSGGAIPAIMDANSLTYVLHRKLGDVAELDNGVRLRLAGALQDSLFQREIIIAESYFRKAFPEQQGYRFFLIQAPMDKLPRVTTQLEDALSDYGFDVTGTAERLSSFHRVENTYLSTFKALGALGLLLGTAGLAAVLLRNVLEIRRELALLRAVGYRPAHLMRMVLAENTLLLAGGLLTGTLCAAVAIAPALSSRGSHAPLGGLVLLVGAVFIAGMAASLAALAAVRRSPLLESLRSE
ncbi:MAG: FtsX-like permease family protein, partial [Acidobacteria bacterium]|nr:FtsX-like permease family protein [Acidobacteriota bacterium]